MTTTPRDYHSTILDLFGLLSLANAADAGHLAGWPRPADARQYGGFRSHIRDAIIAIAGEAIVDEWADSGDIDLDLASRSHSPAARTIASHLLAMGDQYSGGTYRDALCIAQTWIDEDFAPHEVAEWTAVGFWDAATAALLRHHGGKPDELAATAAILDSVGGDAYTDGSSVYAACNGDIDPLFLVGG